tara:strand:+ start:54 stop:620 length:567 start_codon:yes stop_codon:yes gene_type:complete
MRKSINVIINGKYIDVEFKKELKDHNIILTFEIINNYQMICVSIKFENMKDFELTSTDIRKINTHTLIKRGLKAIYSYKNIDKNEFDKNTKGHLKNNINYKNILKDINGRKIKDRNIFLSSYSYIYQHESRNYGDNVSKRLSSLLNYSEGYIKNLTKESFNKNYISKNSKGISGGILTKKTIDILNSL